MSKGKKISIQEPSIVKGLVIWFVICILIHATIGLIASLSLGKRASHPILTSVTSSVDTSFYLSLMALEFKPLRDQYQDLIPDISWSELLLQFTTQLNRTDLRTLFGHELPGFYPYQHRIIIGQTDTTYANLPVESEAPLDVILEDRVASDSDSDELESSDEEIIDMSDYRVFIYNTHNRESFLPHLDDVTDPNAAFHSEINVTLVSERLKQALGKHGIGTLVDQTDFTKVLHDKGWEYWQSYDASLPVVEEAIAQNETISYIFDIHRDSRRKDDTTMTIDGEDYARLFFVVGADFEGNEKNIEFAKDLHERLEDMYPGISRGVVEMGGAGRNGVYNQHVSNQALLIEFGGVDNTLTELYRSADALAKVFAELYWDAEPVSGQN
ncbi:stage II sporulation protein P [Amphibacillus sediminis]|uniref:stage II sporulation protein P n=1 Tax=Amphibacillus sediminis TaxID=360185 RepID=UPI00082A9486|nr:stage II sporulation protein P [Amphibacillus sediminis]